MAVGTTAFPTSLDTVVELVEITNNASSTLSGNVLIGDTTIGVTDISEFPTTGYGTIVDDLTSPTKVEIISWTGKSGSNLTGCTRGTQGTSAAAFSSGNYIEVRPTAGHHEALRGAVIAIETKLGTGSTIAVNKLAALTASRAVVTDGSGFLASATTTAAEIGYLAGVTTPTGSGALVLATSPTLSAPSIARLANLTSNGFVKTSGGDGTLSVDTSTYLTANQTVTLSGDVTGSGSTAITTTIASASVTYAKIQNVSAQYRILARKSASAGSVEECTLSEVLDFVTSAAQGDILYRGAANWERLGAGTSGYFLKTQGAAANPTWAAAATTSNKLGDFAATTSAELAGVISDETGSGVLVFGTSPAITTSLTTASASFDLLNANATTINFGGAATALNMAGGSGAVVKIGGGVNAASLRFMEPSGSGTNYTEFKAQAQTGDVTYTLPAADGSNGQVLSTNGSGTLSWATAGGGLTIGTTAITSGTAGRILYETSGNVVGEIAGSSVDANGAVQFAATARSSGVAQYFRINTPADTGQTTATESVGAYFGGNGSGSTVTRTWAAGTVTTQRENVFVAPTYAGASTTATFTSAATVAITGAPAVGANAAITNPYALWVQGGISRFGGAVHLVDSTGGTDLSLTSAADVDTGIGFASSAGANLVGMLAGGTMIYMASALGINLRSTLQYTFNTNPWGGGNAGFGSPASGVIRVTNASTGAGKLIIGSSSASTTAADLYVVGSAAATVPFRVDSAASPSVDVVQFTNNGTNRWSLNSSTTATTTTATGPNGGTNVTGMLMESVTLNTGGTTTDSTIDLPANSIILSVTGRITTTIATATDWKLGDATIADRFSDANATLTANTTTVGINQWKADRTTAGQGAFQQSTAKVRITTTGTPGAGVIRITIHYITLSAPTS